MLLGPIINKEGEPPVINLTTQSQNDEAALLTFATYGWNALVEHVEGCTWRISGNPAEIAQDAAENPSLAAMTIDDLKTLAGQKGVKVERSDKKPDLVRKLSDGDE